MLFIETLHRRCLHLGRTLWYLYHWCSLTFIAFSLLPTRISDTNKFCCCLLVVLSQGISFECLGVHHFWHLFSYLHHYYNAIAIDSPKINIRLKGTALSLNFVAETNKKKDKTNHKNINQQTISRAV